MGRMCLRANTGDRSRRLGFASCWREQGRNRRLIFRSIPICCGYKLANDGHDTCAIQHYLGHKNIQHTVRYTAANPARFERLWR